MITVPKAHTSLTLLDTAVQMYFALALALFMKHASLLSTPFSVYSHTFPSCGDMSRCREYSILCSLDQGVWGV
jgi:hypothetical protein